MRPFPSVRPNMGIFAPYAHTYLRALGFSGQDEEEPHGFVEGRKHFPVLAAFPRPMLARR